MTKIEELRDFLGQHEPYRYTRLESPKDRPERLLGVNGTHLLLKLLERSYDLLSDCIDAHDRNRTLIFYLGARAHFETTANLSFLLKKLKRFYAGEISAIEIEETVGRLSVGGKSKPTDSPELPVPDPISVMSAMDAVDDLLRKAGSEEDMFRPSYDSLSEFCHPNHFGAAYRTKVDLQKGTVHFLDDAASFNRFGKGAMSYLSLSVVVFLGFYKQAFALIAKNETMPTLVK